MGIQQSQDHLAFSIFHLLIWSETHARREFSTQITRRWDGPFIQLRVGMINDNSQMKNEK